MEQPFNNRTRLHEDPCTMTQENKSNQMYSEYNIPNFQVQDYNQGRNNYLNSSTMPGVFQSNFDGYSQAVNNETTLRYGDQDEGACQGSRLGACGQLNTSGHLNPPDKTSGKSVGDEMGAMSSLMFSEMTNDGTSLRGKSVDRFVPLVPSIKNEIQNPDHYIPTYWVRGGMDTRSVIRNIDYMKTCGIKK